MDSCEPGQANTNTNTNAAPGQVSSELTEGHHPPSWAHPGRVCVVPVSAGTALLSANG